MTVCHCIAGIFIIWDRLFGSFVDEGEDDDPKQAPVPDGDERVVYGILYGVYTWDFFQVQVMFAMVAMVLRWSCKGLASVAMVAMVAMAMVPMVAMASTCCVGFAAPTPITAPPPLFLILLSSIFASCQ